MQYIDISKLKCIGFGSFGTVYRISKNRIVKVYDQHKPEDVLSIMIEEIELSQISKYALPVIDVAVVRNKKYHYYGVIKRYIPYKANGYDIIKLENKLPKILQYDIRKNNVRKDSRNRVYLIDTQGFNAFYIGSGERYIK